MQSISLGAEDYIVKSFEILELIARVNVTIDLNVHKVFYKGIM